MGWWVGRGGRLHIYFPSAPPPTPPAFRSGQHTKRDMSPLALTPSHNAAAAIRISFVFVAEPAAVAGRGSRDALRNWPVSESPHGRPIGRLGMRTSPACCPTCAISCSCFLNLNPPPTPAGTNSFAVHAIQKQEARGGGGRGEVRVLYARSTSVPRWDLLGATSPLAPETRRPVLSALTESSVAIGQQRKVPPPTTTKKKSFVEF